MGRIGPSDWLTYTTSPSGTSFHWTAVRMTAAGTRVLSNMGRGRDAPPGVDRATVNWMMDPDLVHKWAPMAETTLALVQEGTQILFLLHDDPLQDSAILVPETSQAVLPDLGRRCPGRSGRSRGYTAVERHRDPLLDL